MLTTVPNKRLLIMLPVEPVDIVDTLDGQKPTATDI